MDITGSKLTVFFNAGGGSADLPGNPGLPPTGWTETFYSAITNLSTILALGIGYCDKRRQLLGIGASIVNVRVAEMPLVRKTDVSFQLGQKGKGVFTNSPDDDYDVTSTDLLCRMESAEKARRSIFLAGLPDSVTDALKDQGMKAAFLSSPPFMQWMKYIIDNQFGIRQHVRGSGKPGDFTLQTITQITPIMVRRRARGRPFYLFRGRRIA